MSLFTNKHVIVALLVAPVLALIAYFAVDMLVSETPHQAISGQSYPLVAKSNCRYSSGRCSLVNGDVRLELVADADQLTVKSSHMVEGLHMAIADTSSGAERHLALQVLADEQHWQTSLPITMPEQGLLRVALSIAGTTYFAETQLAFTAFETGFDAANINRR